MGSNLGGKYLIYALAAIELILIEEKDLLFPLYVLYPWPCIDASIKLRILKAK